MTYFSIIIPVYNVEKWLERCLDSILADSCKDMELILVDDGSTDQSGRICDSYAAEYANISVVHKPNGGLSSARNAGLEKATGEWISFIDSDDWVDKDTFQTIRTFLSQLENTPDLVKFGYRKTNGSASRDYMPCVPEGEYDRSGIVRKLLPVAFGSCRISDSTMHTFILSSCAHIYRHDFLRKTGVRFISEREVGSEDFLFLDSLYLQASCVYVTHHVWYNYDTREGSLTQRYRKNMYTQYRLLADLVHKEISKVGLEKELADDFKVFYIGLMYICIINECAGQRSRLQQMAGTAMILKDPKLRESMKGLAFADTKSKVIALCIRLKAALPLCLIQWRKAGETI